MADNIERTAEELYESIDPRITEFVSDTFYRTRDTAVVLVNNIERTAEELYGIVRSFPILSIAQESVKVRTVARYSTSVVLTTVSDVLKVRTV